MRGGLPSLLEGLEGFGRPCADRLSVAGFLAIIARFLGEIGFILRGIEASFLGGEAPPIDVPNNGDINPVTITQ